jgi:two-component SAPR family response regulator
LREQAVAVPQMLVGMVEDEALVAMAIKDMLTKLGFEVVGAYNKVTEALAVVTNQDVNAAVLDVNLGGEPTDCLVAKGVPFVFITGYRGEAIDGRFASCRVLQKPIQRQMLQNAFVVGSRGSASDPVASIPTPLGGRAG